MVRMIIDENQSSFIYHVFEMKLCRILYRLVSLCPEIKHTRSCVFTGSFMNSFVEIIGSLS
jgi:hypothetical protein